MHSYRGYVFTIEFDPDPPGYIVDFPDLPDIITSGSTLAEAFAHACEALDLYLESLDQLGRTPPAPRHRLVVEPLGS
ncbi:MAG: type II toxin-antitoxin system HicB family antitoxin, partial [Candidatus Dormibacteraeota bacterium]|nr:type II toxin-antitoxin system HicB family antitoxin [Candidatus Dormibacteraeota bacterium]